MLDDSGRLFREFRVNDVPTVIVADSHGKIVQRVEPGDAQGLKKALDGLLRLTESRATGRNGARAG